MDNGEHGALVEHSGAADAVEDIFSNAKRKREELIKAGESKKCKESPIIDEDLFDIPSNWRWVALGDLCVFLSRGKSPKYSETKKYPVFA